MNVVPEPPEQQQPRHLRGVPSWHLTNSLSPGRLNYAFVRGKANTIPVVGDWDGT
jgi:hypothetical protein